MKTKNSFILPNTDTEYSFLILPHPFPCSGSQIGSTATWHLMPLSIKGPRETKSVSRVGFLLTSALYHESTGGSRGLRPHSSSQKKLLFSEHLIGLGTPWEHLL